VSLPTTPLQPCIRQATEHQRLAWLGGSELAILLDAAITGGQLTVVDWLSRLGDASPVHIHHHDDEVFLLLEWAMTVWAGDRRYQLQPGGFAFLPRNIPHAVRYDMASRALVLGTPAGHEEAVFRAVGWDPAKPPPEGRQITPNSSATPPNRPQYGDRPPARAGRLTASRPGERCAGLSLGPSQGEPALASARCAGLRRRCAVQFHPRRATLRRRPVHGNL